jgi:hypothetical protein
MYSLSDQARLQQLAGYTGGQAFFINSPDQIRSALQSISNDLGKAFEIIAPERRCLAGYNSIGRRTCGAILRRTGAVCE